jgi:hypothetical protein
LCVASCAGFAPCLAARFSLLRLSSSRKSDLVEGLHFSFSASFFFFWRFGELDDGVDAAAFAFAREDALVFSRGGRIGGEGHDAADRGMPVDARAVVAGCRACPLWVLQCAPAAAAAAHFAAFVAV